tara:strand:- start:243 stop:872 length:630 start_codon:yes stop_codon:yes gene_type:complete
MIQLQSNMRIRHYLGGTGPNSRSMVMGVATGLCRNNPQSGIYECEIMTDEINRTKRWMPRTELTAIGNTGTNSIENKPQVWIDNMMAQRGSLIATNFNSVNNTPTQNTQFNNIMIKTGQPHRVGPGNEKLEKNYTSQDDCPPGTTFTTPDEGASVGKCMLDPIVHQQPEGLGKITPKTAGIGKGFPLPAILIVGGFLYYAYTKGLLTKN